MTNQPTKGCVAGCDFSASYCRAANQWSIDPSIGAQIFFGGRGSEYHTGVVVGFDGGHVHTVEGNTGYSAGYSGGAVLERTYGRNDSRITGYGVPRWPMAGGLVSSQPWYCYGYTPSLVSVERCYGVEGSSLVRAIQLVVDADVDGLMGPQTVRCLQA